MPKSESTPGPTDDLRPLVAHRECIQAKDSLEVVQTRFARHQREFMAVLDGERFLGLCSRQQVGILLGARFGFAMYSRRPVSELLVPEITIVRIGQPLAEVLKITCSRPDDRLFDDVPLLDETGRFEGIIHSRTLVRRQNDLLQEKIAQLEAKQKELNEKNEQMEGDLHLAREVQIAMLPSHFPDVTAPGPAGKLSLRFSHCYESAGVVSGDFFHILKVAEGVAGIFICDVMGHGVRSAFLTATLRALVEEMRSSGDNPGELLTRVNRELMNILKPAENLLYATAFYLVADLVRGEIRYAKAGHPHPLRWSRAGGEVTSLDCVHGSKGPALGLNARAEFCTCTAPLSAGDLILLFTDGIYEVFDAAEIEYGVDRLATGARSRREQPLEVLVNGLFAEAKNHAATKIFDDDVCLVALEAIAA